MANGLVQRRPGQQEMLSRQPRRSSGEWGQVRQPANVSASQALYETGLRDRLQRNATMERHGRVTPVIGVSGQDHGEYDVLARAPSGMYQAAAFAL
jgi:hypothetical protein